MYQQTFLDILSDDIYFSTTDIKLAVEKSKHWLRAQKADDTTSESSEDCRQRRRPLMCLRTTFVQRLGKPWLQLKRLADSSVTQLADSIIVLRCDSIFSIFFRASSVRNLHTSLSRDEDSTNCLGALHIMQISHSCIVPRQ